jgi:hypothetical protein
VDMELGIEVVEAKEKDEEEEKKETKEKENIKIGITGKKTPLLPCLVQVCYFKIYIYLYIYNFFYFLLFF